MTATNYDMPNHELLGFDQTPNKRFLAKPQLKRLLLCGHYYEKQRPIPFNNALRGLIQKPILSTFHFKKA